ncbi:hypothetical protein BDP27DRAFT_1368213 [Rhodocollybia butyracea]|uniref:Uncharacterized protein n=1 Tax=Rhodocollybia butyracea TaxID=206335 RepID=A0A9P5PCS4_9AGAR|nr:hypothetical protein BDP27DRAFT_1368213 [Rhodocollybia butyracea]
MDPSLQTKRPAPVESDSNCNVRPCLDNMVPLAPTRAPVDMGKMTPHVPLPSQDLNAQFCSRGYNLEQQTFLADFVDNHRLTVQELQEERDCAARYRSERDHFAGFNAEAHVERTCAELLAVQLKESALSSAVLWKEFLKSQEQTKELEQQLALRPQVATDSKEFLHLEEENRRLRASEDSLCDDLKRAEGTFEAIQSSHEEVLCHNNRMVEASCRVQWGKEALESQLRDAHYEIKALGNMLKSAAGSSNDLLV